MTRATPPAVHGTVLALGGTDLDTVHGRLRVHVFHDLATAQPLLAVTAGAIGGAAPLGARVHSSCITSEAYGGCDCDCAEQLDAALGHIVAAGRGVVFYLMQEGRGAGFAAKARDRMLVQASRQRLTTFDAYAEMGLERDQRRYGAVRAVARLLGIVGPLRLLTNNPEKLATLAAAGVAVDGMVSVAASPSPFNHHYLAAKSGSGHALATPDRPVDTAALPEMVEAFAPHPLPELPRFLRLASYLLPVRGARLAWFRLHAYFDTLARAERVVLTHGSSDGDVVPLLRVQHEALVERLRLRAPVLKRRWQAAVEEIVRHGAGAALFVHGGIEPPVELPVPDDAALDLLASHVTGTRARVLADGAAATPGDAALARALVRRGIAAAAPVALDGAG
jgi:GTP cyclohydrolase II